MNKKETIKNLVCEYAKSFGINSEGWKYVFIHQESIVSRINRNWNKEFIDMQYNKFINNEKSIYNIMQLLMK